MNILNFIQAEAVNQLSSNGDVENAIQSATVSPFIWVAIGVLLIVAIAAIVRTNRLSGHLVELDERCKDFGTDLTQTKKTAQANNDVIRKVFPKQASA